MTETTEQFNRRVAAARFVGEAPQDAQFQMWSLQGYGWVKCVPEVAFDAMLRGVKVRIAPTPKKVLRPAWEVLKMLRPEQFVYNDGGVNIGEVTIAFISQHNGSVRGFNVICLFKWAGKTHIEIGTWGIDLPEEWFTEVEG